MLTGKFDFNFLCQKAAVIGSFLVEYDPAQTTLKHSMSFFVLFGIGMSINALAGVYQEVCIY